MTLTEKVAYLKGLMDGLSFDKNSSEGKIIAAMADVVDDLATTVTDMDEEMETLHDYIEEIDEDLGNVEEAVFDCDDDCDCGDVIEVDCPNCGETVFFDESIDPEHLICPACNKEFSCVCDRCDSDDGEPEEK